MMLDVIMLFVIVIHVPHNFSMVLVFHQKLS